MESCDEIPLGRLIYRTVQDMQNFGEKVLKPYGLTLEQLHILKNLSLDTGKTQRQIGDAVNKTPANLTRILDRLESKSLAVRRRNPEDRRASLVFLTIKGGRVLQEVLGEFESFDKQLFQDITVKEQQEIRKAFGKMSGNLEKMSSRYKIKQSE